MPLVAFDGTVKVMTPAQVGEHVELEIEYETLPGTPERDRDTDCVPPAVSDLVMVFWVKALPLVLVTNDVPELDRE